MPHVLDGLAASGITPPKFNWAVQLDTEALVAWPLISGIVFTFGGLQADVEAQVLHTNGEPIPALYAAGECTGLYYGKYTGATSVIRALTYGRIAGASAAAFAAQVTDPAIERAAMQ